jgi:hypothetical protein
LGPKNGVRALVCGVNDRGKHNLEVVKVDEEFPVVSIIQETTSRRRFGYFVPLAGTNEASVEILAHYFRKHSRFTTVEDREQILKSTLDIQ